MAIRFLPHHHPYLPPHLPFLLRLFDLPSHSRAQSWHSYALLSGPWHLASRKESSLPSSSLYDRARNSGTSPPRIQKPRERADAASIIGWSHPNYLAMAAHYHPETRNHAQASINEILFIRPAARCVFGDCTIRGASSSRSRRRSHFRMPRTRGP